MSVIERFDKKTAVKIYAALKKLDRRAWDANPKDIGVLFQGVYQATDEGKTVKDWTHMGTMIKLIARVAQTCSEDEFLTGLETGELPPIKLTVAEMSLLQGGCSAQSYAFMGAGMKFAGGVCDSILNPPRRPAAGAPAPAGGAAAPAAAPAAGPAIEWGGASFWGIRAPASPASPAGPGNGGVGADGIPNLLRRPTD